MLGVPPIPLGFRTLRMSLDQHLSHLRESAPVILPSLLLCDFGNLEREVRRLEEAGVQALHLDVMDGHFVPNLTYGMPLVDAIRKLTNMTLDVHLMIERPERYVESFCQAGADIVTIHVESSNDPISVLEQIRRLGVGAGIALNPSTDMNCIDSCLQHSDLALVMSVEAGFGGQAFDPIAVERIRQIRSSMGDNLLVEVDGGINSTTIASCAEAGAELFVVGSAIFKQEVYGPIIADLTNQARATKTKG